MSKKNTAPTEKEKMLTGQLYDPGEAVLSEERSKAKDLCFQYNHLPPSNRSGRVSLLKTLIGKMSDNILIEPNFYCDYGYNIEFGDCFYSNHNLVILDPAPVIFGHHVFLGPNCGFYTAGHPFDSERRNAGLEYAYPIRVGNNVWMGGGVMVMPGVTIGEGCVIGSGSVVTKDIPAGVVAMGNPCRVHREISEADQRMF